ncbi:MAG: FtsW/RodA/SpoVE family cell cycle protein [Bacteroidota bacterium]|nr:FtsW/RodA/SpoVE family cell cycle protein [Bacteroidota bacterium]MDP4204701.1 FtsW/RodA/SpoVE family cell cycle protein [Bacteroidota bacterium]
MIKWAQLTRFFKGDRVIWIVLLFLSLISLLIVYSATGSLAYRQAGGHTWYYLFKQIGLLVVGFIIMILQVNYLPVNVYSKISPILIVISIGLILFSLVAGITNEETGRTLNLGIISFQPAELAKIALIAFVARVLATKQQDKESRTSAFYIIIIVTAIICGLISLVNFSTSMLLFVTIMVMMFVGHISLKHLGSTVLACFLFVLILYLAAPILPKKLGRIQTVRARIERYINNDAEKVAKEKGLSQADYGKLAIYQGGLVGKGPGGSNVRNYMAAAYNDYIFAIYIEEYGLIGAFGVILLYLIFLYRGGIIIRRCTRTFPAFLVVGSIVLLALQAMINMGVAVGVLPDTGQPLPWISMGGTSTLFTAVSFGCILSVSYQNQKEKNNFEPVAALEAGSLPDEDQAL